MYILRKHKNIVLPIIASSFILNSCAQKIEIKEVYVPIRCEIPERQKPKKVDFDDFTDFSIHLRTYYKNIEDDLYFCRTGKKKTIPP